MISPISRKLGALAVSFGLAAVVVVPTAEAQPFDETAIRLVIRGMDPNQAMANEARLIGMLSEYGVPRVEGATIGQWIASIRSANAGRGAAVLNGLGGVSARALIWTAQQTLDNPANGNYVGPPVATTTGQIAETCEDENGNPIVGYHFDGNGVNGSGHLCVIMFTTVDPGHASRSITRAERYLVRVNQGFHVETKDLRDPGNVFPAFAQASGLAINSILAEGFNTKLWASGESIRVVRIWRDMNYDPQNPNFQPVNENQPQFERLFEPDPDACIDMMFAGAPPMSLPATMAPPQYCLGRCKNPPIINTR